MGIPKKQIFAKKQRYNCIFFQKLYSKALSAALKYSVFYYKGQDLNAFLSKNKTYFGTWRFQMLIQIADAYIYLKSWVITSPMNHFSVCFLPLTLRVGQCECYMLYSKSGRGVQLATSFHGNLEVFWENSSCLWCSKGSGSTLSTSWVNYPESLVY